jgi:hypothetical protein
MGACASTGQPIREEQQRAAAWRTVAVASAGADLATTFIGQRSGAREQNALLGQRPQRIVAINAAILGAVWWFSRDLPPEQQTRIWKWVAALHLGAALSNGMQLKR